MRLSNKRAHRGAIDPMARGTPSFRKRDVTRGIAAAEDAGHKVKRIEIDRNGKITLVMLTGDDESEDDDTKPDGSSEIIL